jgi:hypothetical protein
MRKGKSTKEQEEENARILSEFVSSEDPELIYELTEILGKGYRLPTIHNNILFPFRLLPAKTGSPFI